MDTETDGKIRDLENFLGFRIRRERITFASGKSHDETFSYNMCQRFYGKDDELMLAIRAGNDILLNLLRDGSDRQMAGYKLRM